MRRLIAILACGLSGAPAPAQAPSASAAQVEADLSLYLGDFDFVAHGVETPFQHAAEWHGIVSGSWFPGHYGVIRNNVMIGPNGMTRIIQMLGYDRTTGETHLSEVTEDGFVAVEKISFTGGAMVARFDQVLRGRLWHMRWTLTRTDAAHRHYLREYSSDGAVWKTCWESVETRR